MPFVHTLSIRLVFLALALLFGLSSASAQSLIPGLPGSLGGATASDATTDNGGSSPDPTSAGDAEAVSEPVEALIDILRDDAAREALIRELESASSGLSTGTVTSDAEEAEPHSEAPAPTFGDRAVAATRSVGGAVADELGDIWLRIKRIPFTIELAARAWEDAAVETAIREVLGPFLAIYASLIALRLIFRPLRARFAGAAEGSQWFKTLLLRVSASVLDVALLPFAVTIGLFALLLIGVAAPRPGEEFVFTDAQTLFVNAFIAVEVARAVIRFFLSPRSADLRVLPLPESGARSLWRVSSATTYTMGYGQLLFVPVISAGVSVFVGRAAAAVLSAIVVALFAGYVMANRDRVARWLVNPDASKTWTQAIQPLAMRWHWPVLAYLAYLFTTVLTRPGNVLLPLLQTTGEVILVIVTGSILLSAITGRAARRLKLPDVLTERLPLLEERVNQIRPAILTILRFFIFLLMVIVLLNVLGLQQIGGLVSSAVLQQFSSGLFSVLLIVGLLSLVWIAMTSWVDYRLNPFVGAVPTPREITLLTLLKNAVTVGLVVVGAITSLAQLGMNVGPLIASAGVIGLAISFGAQRMVEDIFSGIFIQAENAMNVGDVVDVAGTSGTVEKLTVRSVTLRDLSGVVHVIPFSSAAKISNYMRDYAYHVADIGVAYREDLDDVRVAMHDAFEMLREDPDYAPHLLGDLEWFGLNAFGPSELVVRARIKTVPGQQWAVGRAYNALVKDLFDAREIEIPFPHQTLYFGEDKSGNAPPLHLQMQRRTSVQSGEGAAQKEVPSQNAPPDRASLAGSVSGQDMPDEDGR